MKLLYGRLDQEFRKGRGLSKEDIGGEAKVGAANASEAPGTIVLEIENSAVVEVPGGGWLLGAEFSREGPDLLLLGKNGERVIIRDFFKAANPPDLRTDNSNELNLNSKIIL